MTEFTLELVNQAIAAVVVKALPGVTVYASPNQQHTRLPALFIGYRGEQALERQVGSCWLRRLRYDLAYLEQRNLPDLGERYQRVAEALDLALETIPFADGRPLRTTKRCWLTELDGLHYHIDLTVRVAASHVPQHMEQIKLKEGIV